jgi:transcription elongation factor Elf1
MTDLWTSASVDVEAENLDRHLTSARIASAAVWPFLAAATSEVEYTNRKALAADRIDRVAAAVAENDPALFSVVRASLEDGFDQDFAVLHADRVATAKIEATKTRARKMAEASIRRQAEREALDKVLAAGLDNLGDAKAEPFGEAEEDKEAAEKTAAFDPIKSGFIRCNSCKNEFRRPKEFSGNGRCPKCKSSDLKSNASLSTTAGDLDTCAHCGKSIEDDDGTWYHTESMQTRCDGDDDEEGIGWGDLVRQAEPKTSAKTAAFPPAKDGNPFGSKKPADDGDAGAPDHNADQQGGSWQCPQCGSANAYTQGGVDLDEALKAKQPIQCGDCKQVDSTGGSAGTQDANGAPKQDQPSPGAPPVHASRHPFVSTSTNTSGGQGVTVTYVSTTHPLVTATGSGNPYADANPYTQTGTPDDQMDGPAAPPPPAAANPETTRPRVMPAETTPAPTSAPAAGATGPGADTTPASPPPPKKAAGLGFTSAAFKTAASGELSNSDIPKDHPVQPTNSNGLGVATCGNCGLSWDDSKSTSMTPAPSGRCPFEAYHKEES